MVTERPGMAPTQMPAKTPTQMRTIISQLRKGMRKY